MTRVLAIFIDALRYDFVNQKDTPFLYALSQRGVSLPLRPILGYSDSIRATIFTGARPDKHGYWMSYRYSPESSPFKALKALRFIDRIPSDLIRRGIKFILSRSLGKLLAKSKGYPRLDLHNIPFSLIHRFDATLRKAMLAENPFPDYPTIFDILRATGMKFAYFDSTTSGRKLLAQIQALDPETRFVLVYLHHLDQISHWFGLNSRAFKRSLRSVDALANDIARLVSGRLREEPVLIVFSDHGMIEEKSRIDLSHLMRLDGFGDRFLLVLDATMARAWYFSSGTRERVRLAVEQIGHSTLLTDQRKIEFGIDFKCNGYGDDIFLYEPGFVIFPNFYSYIRPRAMHAYDPEHPTQRGVFILQGCNEARFSAPVGHVDVVDIMPTILSILDVPAPPTCEGRSMVHERATTPAASSLP